MNIQLNRGWAWTFGVFFGFQLARLQDKLPFVMRTLNDIREATTGKWLENVSESVDTDDEDDE